MMGTVIAQKSKIKDRGKFHMSRFFSEKLENVNNDLLYFLKISIYNNVHLQ